MVKIMYHKNFILENKSDIAQWFTKNIAFCVCAVLLYFSE